MDRGPRVALTTLATVLAVLGLLAGYVAVELAEPGPFADRGVAALQREEVRAVIAEQVAVDVLERRSPGLIATRPLVLAAVEALLETDAFERVLRESLQTAHGVLVGGDTDVTVELTRLRDVLVPALESASPRLAAQVPTDLRTEVAALRSSDVAVSVVRTAEGASAAALPLLLAAFALLAFVVARARDRRAALAGAGLSLGIGMAVGTLAVVALRAQVVSHTDAIGVVSQEDAAAAAGAAFDALAADLQRAFVVVGALGFAVWLGSVLVALRVDRRAALGHLGEALAGGALPWPVRVGRGSALGLVGLLVLLRVDPVFDVAVVTLGVVVLALGITEVLSVARAAPRPAPRRPPRRRGAVLAGVVVLAAAGVTAVLLTREDVPEPLAESEITACNGLAELCDRRLDQVVLAGTHNAMSAADRPGWLFANQTRPIPRQLEDGIRLLLIDPHYGRLGSGNRVRTDLAAEGTSRNRAAAELGPDAIEAAEGLAGRLGLVPRGGRRRTYLCHTLCELGAEPIGSALGDVRDFLAANRAEVVVLLVESSIEEEDLVDAVEEAELSPFLAVLPRSGPLPTLRRLITTGRRLVVLDDGDGGREPWYPAVSRYAQTTDIDAFTASRTSCRPGGGAPDAPLLLMYHWVDRFPPPAGAAADVNRRAVLEARLRACRERLGRLPTAIAVDFHERGDVVAVARELNRSGALVRRP